MNFQVFIKAVLSKTNLCRKIPKYFKFVKKMNLNVCSFSSSQNIFHDLKGCCCVMVLRPTNSLGHTGTGPRFKVISKDQK